MRNKLKRSLALFMAGVLVASSINISAFAEETAAEPESRLLEETVQETAEDAEPAETATETAAETSESAETAAETSELAETAAETSEPAETAAEIPESAETVAETAGVVETEAELESVNNAETEAYPVLKLDEMTTITESDIPEDGMVKFQFTPEVSGRYCIEVNGDLEYYYMHVSLLNRGWEAVEKWNGFVEGGTLCECTVSAENSKSFNILVTKLKDIETVEMLKEPYKKTYMSISDGTFGIDDSGMEVRVVYTDGTEEILQDGNNTLADGESLTMEPMDIDWSSPAPGTYTIVYSIGNHQISYDIQIMDKETYLARLPELVEDKETQADTGNGMIEFRFTPKKSGIYMFKAVDADYHHVDSFITGGGFSSAYAHMGLELTAGETYVYSILYRGNSDVLNIKATYAPKISEFTIAREPYRTSYRVCPEGVSGDINLDGLKMHIVYDDGSEEDVAMWDCTSYGVQIYSGWNDINWNVPGDYSVDIDLDHGGLQYTSSLTIHILAEEDYLQTVPKVEENRVNAVPASSYSSMTGETKFEFSFTPSVTGYYNICARQYDGSAIYDLSVIAGDIVLQTSADGETYGAQLIGGVTYIFSSVRTYYADVDEIDVTITKQEQKPVKELILNKKPNQLTYKVVSEENEGAVNTTGLSVDVVFEDGTRETVENDILLRDGRSGTADSSAIDWNTPGTYTYRITLDGAGISFDIEIQDADTYLKALPELSEQPVDFSLTPNMRYGWFYEPHAQRCAFTPSESGYYILEMPLKDGAWADEIGANTTFVEFHNPYTDERIYPAGRYTDGMDRNIYEIYLQKGETYLISLNASYPVECSVAIKKALDVKSVKIVSLPKVTEFVRGYSYYDDVYTADGLSVEIEYADGTKEILKRGELSKQKTGIEVDYSYEDFQARKTTVTVKCRGKSDTYEIKFIIKEELMAKAPTWQNDGQEITFGKGEEHTYRIDIEEDGVYEFDSRIDPGTNAALRNDEYSYMKRIQNQNKSYIYLNRGTYYLSLRNGSLDEETAAIKIRKLKNIKDIEIANKDALIEQMPWIQGISSVNDYMSCAEVRLLYEDGTTEVLDNAERLTWGDYQREAYTNIVWVGLEWTDFKAEMVLPIVKLSDKPGVKNINVNENVIVEPTEGQTGSVYKFTVPETKEYYISYNRVANPVAYDGPGVLYLVDEGGKLIRTRDAYNYSDIVNTLESGETYYVYIPNSQAGGNLRITSEEIVIHKDDSQKIYYTGAPQKLDFKVTLAGKTLTEGKDYSVTYVNNVEAGTAKAIIKPIKANAFPEYHAYFEIIGKNLHAEDISIEPVEDQKYTGDKITPEVIIKDGDKVLEFEKDYYILYDNNVDAGTARMLICGMGNYYGRTVRRFEIVKKTAVSGIALNKTAVTLTGKSDTVALKATVKPEDATDKSVTWSSSNAKVAKVDSSGVITPVANGTAVITATTKDGNKTATCKVTVKFPTVATLTNLKAVTNGPSKVKLTWNVVSGAEGYLIYAQKNGKYGYVGMTTKGTTYTDTKALTDDYNFYWVFPFVKDAKGNMYTGGCQSYKYAKGGVCPAVTNLKATSETGQVRLTWKASAGAEGYLVYGKTATGKYGYIGMTTKGTTYVDKKASKTEYNFYWVFPYHKDANKKMIVGGTPKYVYGKAK
ncbi:Ig-like domain-containing protein [Frisingicoccus sp.]|uniref:Ig-like domain-containing protein n=1 Tax=Frisingicoccus sp. TaxID=1918627 RepID=UPI003AB80451